MFALKAVLTLIAVLSLAFASAARAADPLSMALTMNVYGGGLHLLTVDTTTVIDGASYEMKTQARSEGMMGWATRFQLETLSQGLVEGSAPEPTRYGSASDGRWGKRASQMVWRGDGRPTVTRLEPKREEVERFPVPEGELASTLDPPAAGMIRALASVTHQPCEGTSRIFDARRRYNLHFKPAGTERLAPNRYSGFAGEALKCEVRYEPIGGGIKNQANMAEAAAAHPIRLWLSKDVDPRIWLPVRLEMANDWANIVIHLVRAEVDGNTRLALAK